VVFASIPIICSIPIPPALGGGEVITWKPDILYLQNGFAPETERALERMGYRLEPTDGVARVEAIVANDGVLEGGTESHQHGKVAGY
jgi:gamma-glutamyltranspeptidase